MDEYLPIEFEDLANEENKQEFNVNQSEDDGLHFWKIQPTQCCPPFGGGNKNVSQDTILVLFWLTSSYIAHGMRMTCLIHVFCASCHSPGLHGGSGMVQAWVGQKLVKFNVLRVF